LPPMDLGQLVNTLNDNSGAIVAVSATVSAVLTILLLLDARATRNLRREANVVAHPRLHGEAGMQLELRVTNHGPADARDVSIEFRFKNADGSDQGGRRQVEPLLPSGEDRRFLPSVGEQLMDLNTLAGYGLALHVNWSWSDDRRRLWFLPKRHERSEIHVAEDLRSGLYGGWSLTRRDTAEDVHSIAEILRSMLRTINDMQSDERTERLRMRTGNRQRMPSSPPSAMPPKNQGVWEYLGALGARLRALARRLRPRG
jgi:hypothetical protein